MTRSFKELYEQLQAERRSLSEPSYKRPMFSPPMFQHPTSMEKPVDESLMARVRAAKAYYPSESLNTSLLEQVRAAKNPAVRPDIGVMNTNPVYDPGFNHELLAKVRAAKAAQQSNLPVSTGVQVNQGLAMKVADIRAGQPREYFNPDLVEKRVPDGPYIFNQAHYEKVKAAKRPQEVFNQAHLDKVRIARARLMETAGPLRNEFIGPPERYGPVKSRFQLFHRAKGAAGAMLGDIAAHPMVGAGRLMGSAAKTGYNVANVTAKVATGASVPQLALAGGILGGVFLGAENLLDRDPVSDISTGINAVASVGKAFRQKSYGTTVYQQSTQGLSFGLNSRRTSGWQL